MIDNLLLQLRILQTAGKTDTNDGHPDLYVTSSDSLKARLALSRSSENSPSSTPAIALTNPFHDYTPLRKEIIRLSDGIFKAPPGWSIPTKSVSRREEKFLKLMHLSLPIRLPERKRTELILDIFREKVEKMLYIMNWPEFEQNVELMYSQSVNGLVPASTRFSFVRFFFGLLGFTMIWTQDERICGVGEESGFAGHEYMAVAYQMPLTTQHFHLDDVRAGLQVIFWLKCANFLPLAHVWCGSTIKIATELGTYYLLQMLIVRTPSRIRRSTGFLPRRTKTSMVVSICL